MQMFARKVVRLVGRGIGQTDIRKEVLAVSSICATGGHKNIIEILDHGWLKGQDNVYFIDMELADFTLADYIDYHSDSPSKSSIAFDAMPFSIPVFVQRECSFQQRIRNMWAIGSHIAAGLEFMHEHNQVHRDVKPLNGVHLPIL